MSTNLFTLVDAIARKEQELYELRRELSRSHVRASLPEIEFAVLRCRMHGYAVALIASELREVVRMAELVVLPESPAWFMGLLSVGPQRIPVIDLWAREHGTRRSPDPSEFIVIAETKAGPCGLVVEALEGLVTLEPSQISRPDIEAPFGAYVMGVVDIAAEPVLLLSAVPVSTDRVILEAAK